MDGTGLVVTVNTAAAAITPEQRRSDVNTVSRAIEALSSSWCRDVPPDMDAGLRLPVEARLALARLAVVAGVPPAVLNR